MYLPLPKLNALALFEMLTYTPLFCLCLKVFHLHLHRHLHWLNQKLREGNPVSGVLPLSNVGSHDGVIHLADKIKYFLQGKLTTHTTSQICSCWKPILPFTPLKLIFLLRRLWSLRLRSSKHTLECLFHFSGPVFFLFLPANIFSWVSSAIFKY